MRRPDRTVPRRGTGSKNRRCVSKKPTERKNGCGGGAAEEPIAAGATSLTRVVSIFITWSYPMMSGRFEMCCSPISVEWYPTVRSVCTMWWL